MLAKATKAGRGFAGKIDYLYEGKLQSRGETNKKATIITHSENLIIPRSVDDIHSRNLLKAEFISQAKRHEDYGKSPNKSYVGEHILSFTNEDRKQLNTEKLREITEEYIKMAGLDKTQYLAISHHDTDNLHVHILFNRAMDDGTKYKAWKEQNKTIERGIALALEHGFTLVKNQIQIANSKEVIKLRSEMSDIKDLRNSNELLSKAKNLHHLQKLCEAKQISFSKDENLRTVTMDSKTYQEANLQAVFLLNRMENTSTEKKKEVNQSKTNKYDYPSKSKQQTENIEDESTDLKLKKQIKTIENESKNRIKKQKRQAGFQIKIQKIKKKEELKKGRGI
jgi:hypothetical protein